MFKIGKKFNIGSFTHFLIPIYNLYLLTQCAGLPATYLLLNLIPFVGPIIFATMVYGNIAVRLQKDYWLYGLGSALIGIPVFILAFDQSLPTGTPSLHQQQYPAWNENDRNQYIGSNAFLVGVSGSYQGSVIPIPVEGIVIGRDPNYANIIIDHTNVSKAHVQIFFNPSTYSSVFIEDLGSTNGTFIHTTTTGNQWSPLHGQIEINSQMNGRLRIGNDGEIFELSFMNHTL